MASPNFHRTWFFCLLQVRVQAVLSILLATFAGFGVVMSGSSILVEIYRWRRRLQALSEQRQGPQMMPQTGQNPRSSNTSHSDSGSGPSNHTQPVVQNEQNSNQSWIDVFVWLLLTLEDAADCFSLLIWKYLLCIGN